MKIAVLGCGWLGLALAKRLVQDGHEVNGSVTRKDKIPSLVAAGITPFKIDLTTRDVSGIHSFLMDAEVLIVTVPPKHQSAYFNLYAEMSWLLSHVVIQKVPRVLYTSSISVYENKPSFPVYSEQDAEMAVTGKAAALLQVEGLMLREEAFQVCVLRLGGLLGLDRHPIKFLAGQKNVSNPAAPVNLVHQEDCIGVILTLLNRVWYDGILNVVHPAHPSKREYYTAVASRMDLSEPQFSEAKSIGKIVSSDKLQRILNYTFQAEI